LRKDVLEGVRVLDLSRVLAGPFCTMLLADMGAEVIKIEVPKKGDDSRRNPPFKNGESAYYMNLNRNKKGITLNLKTQEGKEIFKELVKKADIVIENFRPGTMEKLGVGYEELKKVNPKIIYGCVSGFGHYGPYKDRAGYDIISQAMGGLMSTSGWPDGEPTRSGTAIGDVLAGLNLAVGVLAAYHHVKEGGEGQKVDVALVDSVVSAMEIINQIYLVEGRIPKPIGNRYEAVYPYDSFKAKDGSLVIACGNDKLYGLLCKLMNREDLITDERFDTNANRIIHHKELKPIIEEWLKDKTIDEAVDMMLDTGIPAAPINTIDRIVKDPHIADAREMFVEIEHPIAGKLKVTNNAIKFSDTKTRIRTVSPLLGQHNHEVLSGLLGMSREEIEELEKKEVF
jgi:CoA:oxalate CoA-transferase